MFWFRSNIPNSLWQLEMYKLHILAVLNHVFFNSQVKKWKAWKASRKTFKKLTLTHIFPWKIDSDFR